MSRRWPGDVKPRRDVASGSRGRDSKRPGVQGGDRVSVNAGGEWTANAIRKSRPFDCFAMDLLGPGFDPADPQP